MSKNSFKTIVKKIKAKFKKRFKYFKEILEIFVSISTLVSVLLIGAGNHEVRVQRQSAYKPILAMTETNYDFYYFDNFDDEYTDEHGSFIFDKANDILDGSPDLKFTIENIGLGIAKNIVCEWSDENLKKFSEYFKENDKRHPIEIDSDGDYKIIKQDDSKYFSEDVKTNEYFQYIKTYESENYFFKLNTKLVQYLCILDSLKYNKPDHPCIKLNIEYEDMYSYRYKAEIVLTYDVEKIQLEENEQEIVEADTYYDVKTKTKYTIRFKPEITYLEPSKTFLDKIFELFG